MTRWKKETQRGFSINFGELPSLMIFYPTGMSGEQFLTSEDAPGMP